jgi:tyrosine-protein phosphatase SIW14
MSTRKLFSLVIGAVILSSCTSTPRVKEPEVGQEVIGVNNFQVIEQDMYRSGRPSIPEIEMLAQSFNIKTILSVETYLLDPEYAKASREAAEDFGIEIVNVPIPPVGHLDKIAARKALEALKTLPRPILIHCYRGSERTGIVVAAYRMSVHHWTYDQAVKEMDSYGFNPLFNGWKKEIKEIANVP